MPELRDPKNPYHEFCKLLPEHPRDDLETLKEDIEANGQQKPIILLDGYILDGRGRYQCCKALGVPPRYMNWKGKTDRLTLLHYVYSENAPRRHLTPSQKAVVFLTFHKLFQEEAEKRRAAGKAPKGDTANLSLPASYGPVAGKSAAQAAKAANVSTSTMEATIKARNDGVPELLEAVRAGWIPAKRAATIAKLPEAEQRKVIAGIHLKLVEKEQKRDARDRKKDDAEREANRVARVAQAIARERQNVGRTLELAGKSETLARVLPAFRKALRRALLALEDAAKIVDGAGC